MKKGIFSLLMLVSLAVFGQFDVGSAWYLQDVNRPFVKLMVAKDGIYRVYDSDLQAAGYNLSGINLNTIKLYYRGAQVPIYVEANAGNLSFVEFYGKQNDGRVDSIMYRDASSGFLPTADPQPNKEVSWYSDSSAYFMTWGGVVGDRLNPSFNTNYPVNPEPSFMFEAQYIPGKDGIAKFFSDGGSSATSGTFSEIHVLNSDYVVGEGWVGPTFGNTGTSVTNRQLTLSTKYPYAGATNPTTLTTRVFFKSNTTHKIKVGMGSVANQQGTIMVDTTIAQPRVDIQTFKRTYTQPLTNTTYLSYRAEFPTDNNNVCWAVIRYERDANQEMGRDSFFVVNEFNKSTNAYLRFRKIKGQTQGFVYDLQNFIRYQGIITTDAAVGGDSVLKVMILPSSSGKRDLIVTTDIGIKKAVIVNPRLSNLHAEQGADYVIITHRGFESVANAYKTYRDTCTTNPLPNASKIVYTDQIFDEYGYGSVTGWAIKRFCYDALTNWAVKPKYFLILGKTVYKASSPYFVPELCNPASDYEFVNHFSTSTFDLTPRAGIGRVSVANEEAAMAYLSKVNVHEHTPWQEWMKEGVFLGGGKDVGDVTVISNTLLNAIKIYEGVPFGGNAFYYQNLSSAAIPSDYADYHDYISTGAGWIHFFGHSAANLLDVNLKDPSEYSNYSRTPIIFAEGCKSGYFGDGTAIGERWLSQPNRGAVAWIANHSFGYATELSKYSNTLYPIIYQSMLGERLGDVLKKQTEEYIDIHGTAIGYRNHARQMNLQGDPLIKMHVPPGRDLEVLSSGIYFTPDNFSALEDSFKINVIIRNLGLVDKDTFTVSIRQMLPDGTWYSHPSHQMSIPRFQDTLSVFLKNPVGNGMTGPNTFEVFVDSTLLVTEYNENNNIATILKSVPGNIPAILFPIEYSVIDENQPTLVASGYSMDRDSTVNYVFEADVKYDFSSPQSATSGVIVGKSCRAEWKLPFVLQDSAVVYWRVRLADAVPSLWANASFRYINTKRGWAQAEVPQFTKDKLEKVEVDLLQDKWNFSKVFYDVQVRNKPNDTEFSIDQAAVSVQSSLTVSGILGGVCYAMIDGLTLDVKSVTSISGTTKPVVLAEFPAQIGKFKNDLAALKTGDYFFISSIKNARLNFWTNDLFDMFTDLGVSDYLQHAPDSQQFVIYGRKGFPSTIEELYAPNNGQNIVFNKTIYTYETNANVTSTTIGPSKEWKKLIWGWKSQDNVVKEDVDVEVYGVKADGTSVLQFKTDGPGTYDMDTISVNQYPFMYLQAAMKDSVYHTAPQLDNWHVLYDHAPDAVIDPFSDFMFNNDTLQEGQAFVMQMGAVNPSDVNMDSLLVNFRVQLANRQIVNLGNKRFAPLPSKGRILVKFDLAKDYAGSVASIGLDGNVNFIVELNPNKDQTEQYDFNNTYIHSMYVQADKSNPLLDITFDGKRILDQDIVSPTPEILVQAKDDNPFLAMTDTSTFDVYLGMPGSSANPTRISINDPRIVWKPASLPENRAKLYFYPGISQPLDDSGDDFYTLRVQGRDARGNNAGNKFYEIKFRVVNEHTITNVLNYPNPFSTSTRFAYILTGDELPEVFQIQIFTITGKLVKTIDLKALGDVKFGKNVTEYAWDGTDEFGDKLANGVYVYRVVTKMKSATLKASEDDNKVDNMFNKGWGKMYIMR